MTISTLTRPKRAVPAKKRKPTTPERLRRYRRKRDLRKSGEPSGEGTVQSGGPLTYVIQMHDATRLHYDFRLEMEGVLKSWAVPKGLPAEPGQKSLAVEVEDHPLDYGSFEGTIPEGNYGAGTVMVWDRGYYTVEGGDPLRALKQGKIHFALAGEKCHGEWTLVRMRTADKAGKVNWLLIKNHDIATASPIRARGRDLSAKTGRTLEQIAGDKPAKPRASRRAAATAPRLKTSTRIKKKPLAPASVPSRATSPDTTIADTPSDSSAYLEPMKALSVEKIPTGDWLLEIKFDGFRALAIIDRKGSAGLWSRNRNVLSHRFPEVMAALAHLSIRDCVIDGEIVALDDAGRPRFQLLQGLEQRVRPPILYYAFDLLRFDGKSLLRRPIEERKEILERVLKNAPPGIRLSPVFRDAPEKFLEEIRRKGLEGIIAKQAGSLYEAGRRSGRWLKCRVAKDQEFVIGGYTRPQGARSHFGAIVVGYYEGDRLLYAGKVGTGFDEKKLTSLYRQFSALITPVCPFANLPMPNKPRFGLGMTSAAMREVTWLRPKLVAQIRFTEWTREGSLRHPVFLGLREDKNAKDVVREVFAEE